MRLQRITAPASEPVTISEAKAHLRVDDSNSDSLITGLITAARLQAEHATGRALMAQTWDVWLDGFSGPEIEIPLPPLQSITSIKYIDGAGVQQTLAGTEYSADTSGINGRVLLGYGKSWPATRAQSNAVVIRFVAGYADAASVPQCVKQWMLLQIAHWFENREAASDGKLEPLPFVGGLLDPVRVY